MGVVTLGTNIASLRAQRQLSLSSASFSATAERLSSGQRINRASDDAAGLAISSSLRKDARVYGQALRNGNDAISALNIADGTLEQLTNVTFRLKELATSAANGTLGRTQRISLDQEAGALTDEFNRLLATTEFNNLKLLDGSNIYMSIQLGFGSNGSIGFGLGTGLSHNAGTGYFGSDLNVLDYSGASGSSVLNDLRSADLNGDGFSDMVISTAGEITVSLSNGDGTFRAPVTAASFAAGSSVQLADVNGDGRADLIASSLSSGNILVSINNGDGTFQAGTTLSAGFSPGNYMRAGDVNGDGKIDIAVTGASGGLAILLGNGNGTFKTAIQNTFSIVATNLTLADVNNDGKLDATIGTRVLLGNGDGTFGAATVTTGVSTTTYFADINRDGYLDSLTGGGSLSVRFGNGDGTFGSVRTYTTGGGTVTYGDFNNDGLLDAVAASGSAINTLFGNADGTFGSRITTNTALSNGFVVSGDFNGDGVLDLMGGTSATASIDTVLSQTQNTTQTQRFNLTTVSTAREALSLLDLLMARVQKDRGLIGATMSRISASLSNLGTLRENSIAAADRITNADVASESAQLVRHKIIQETASAVLAQANQQPALALTLLRG